ncbi:hypothetical protein BJ123_110129 [Rhodopseudomonas thermotolerans]|uniref:Uncharacterized protein n=2 Tax=Rhodopseudomonas TaxID=1073 RepID=A0A336JST5_9BRAD|nr:hypothetical protein BJ125_110129 [Rhodopseudomonas pentothenatexigens]REG02686.1 hypothetical protein BJ123_110129 [Rhodopseudomonas thermotolerans]SSW91159.1 hypothetical protein SAMN05892882_110129 [Rhodopseudomonas pentothenatexigens]
MHPRPSPTNLVPNSGKGISVKKRRNRTKQHLSLEQRLSEFSDRWKQEAEESGDREAQENWERRARSTQAALGMIAWLGSREVRR